MNVREQIVPIIEGGHVRPGLLRKFTDGKRPTVQSSSFARILLAFIVGLYDIFVIVSHLRLTGSNQERWGRIFFKRISYFRGDLCSAIWRTSRLTAIQVTYLRPARLHKLWPQTGSVARATAVCK